jgi:predicted DNA-binding protein (UPF0251 family)
MVAGRPKKWRCVSFNPEVTYFKPAGIPLRFLQDIQLSIEEAEAIRLKDIEGLVQEKCADRMKISRPTFHRVLYSARKKVADALLNGKAIRIEGGTFQLAMSRFACAEGHEWDVPAETSQIARHNLCPVCNSSNILPVQHSGFGQGGKRWGRSRHRHKHIL